MFVNALENSACADYLIADLHVQVYADVCEPKEGRWLARSVRSAGAKYNVRAVLLATVYMLEELYSDDRRTQSCYLLQVPTFSARALLKRREAGSFHTFGGVQPNDSSDDSGFPSEDVRSESLAVASTRVVVWCFCR